MERRVSVTDGNLYAELADYERKGVDILLDGYPASPLQVLREQMMHEDFAYMRDYVMNETGDVKTLCFNNIKKQGKD